MLAYIHWATNIKEDSVGLYHSQSMVHINLLMQDPPTTKIGHWSKKNFYM